MTTEDHFNIEDAVSIRSASTVQERKMNDQGTEREMSVSQLLLFLLRDMEKTKHYRRLPFYVCFLTVLTLLVGLTGLGDAWYNETADKNFAVSDTFHREDLRVIKDPDQVWTWLYSTLSSIWVDSGTNSTAEEVCTYHNLTNCPFPCSRENGVCVASSTGRHNVALGFLLLRQWRVREHNCSHNSGLQAIAPELRIKLPISCPNRYSDSEASTAAFGSTKQFLSDDERQISSIGSEVTTTVHTFPPSKQSSIRLSLDGKLQVVSDKLTELRSGKWISPETRLISLDGVFLNPSTGTFVSNTAYVEFFHTGRLLTGYQSRPFPILALDTSRERTIFALDLIHLVIITPALLWSSIRTVKDNFTWMRIPGHAPVGLWEIFELVHIASHVVTCYHRVDLWVRSKEITDSGFYSATGDNVSLMFQTLVEYSEAWRSSWAWTACVIVLSYLRVFKYLQYNQRLCVLSETVRTAAGDLAGMCIIFLIVLSAYGIGGTMLYAWEVEEFASFGTSCAYLLQILFAGEIVGGTWNDLFKMHKVASPIYMLSYFLLSYIVLLNMVIAALSNSFILVVQQQAFYRKAASGAHRSLFEVIGKGVRKGYLRLKGALAKESKPVIRSAGLKRNFTEITECIKVLAHKKIQLVRGTEYIEDFTAAYSETYITWTEVSEALSTILTQGELEVLYCRISKVVAVDEKSAAMLNISQRYCHKMTHRMTETLQILRNIPFDFFEKKAEEKTESGSEEQKSPSIEPVDPVENGNTVKNIINQAFVIERTPSVATRPEEQPPLPFYQGHKSGLKHRNPNKRNKRKHNQYPRTYTPSSYGTQSITSSSGFRDGSPWFAEKGTEPLLEEREMSDRIREAFSI
eukprot:TRINITY_DN9744_c0_g1_i1.p1 TRINITY_DN9744_c0_g1~~TRINITY_DN9744_c0_g1_i1.p1  ORF type:complete len:859 (+),score=108.38 TRINITY_DN9744_c0_g1_i1:61-2637(+)